MNCKESNTYLERYYKGELAEEVRISISAHLLICKKCAADLDAIAGIERFIEREKSQKPNPFLSSIIIAKINNKHKREPVALASKLHPLTISIAIAASILLGIITGGIANNQQDNSSLYDMALIDDSSLESITQLVSE